MTSDIRTPKTFYVSNKTTAVIWILAIIVTVTFVGYCIGVFWIEGGNCLRRGGETGTLDEGQADSEVGAVDGGMNRSCLI